MAKESKILIGIIIGIIFIGCNQLENNADSSPPPLHQQPKVVPLNLNGGYKVNQRTGDSIKPIINSMGDTVITGKPIPAKGKYIHPDSVSKPKVVKAGTPKIVLAHTNVHKIPDNLTVIPVNKDSLKVCYVDSINSDFVLVNSTGDTIPTGIPIPVKGKIASVKQLKPVPALAPRMKHNAINNMQYLDIEQGMASSFIFSMLEDKNGNLWFGTLGGGVSKYDGYRFLHFFEIQNPTFNWVYSILEDIDGNIWFGTDAGVSIYDGEKFTHYAEKEGFSKNGVGCIVEDKHENLWFGSMGGGVSKYNGESFTHFTEKEGLSSNSVRSIIEDKDGNLWIGTSDGVNKYDGKSFTHFTEKDGLSNNSVESILEDKNGNLWFGTWGGMNKYDGVSFTHYTKKEGLSNDNIRSIIEDKNGDLWLGTSLGVNKYDGESFTHYTEKEGLSNNVVLNILEDMSGNLWFGTRGGGVSIYAGKSFVFYSKEEGLSDNSVWPIMEDRNGNLWFGSSGGVNKYDGNSFTYYTEKEGFPIKYVRSIHEDKNGNMWFGSGAGISKFDGQNFTNYSKKEGFPMKDVRSILEDKDGKLWFGSAQNNGSVSIYNGKSFKYFTEKEGLSNNFVLSILEDKAGNLWFGTVYGGVSKYDGESFTHYTEKEGLLNNLVISILEHKDGSLWFGSSAGVCKFDGESFTYYIEKEGLVKDYGWSLIEDNNHNIWVASNNGLLLFVFDNTDVLSNINNVEEKGNHINEIINFNKRDGLKGLSFEENSVFLDSKNRLWWGSNKGLTMLDMNKFSLPKSQPKIQLNTIEIQQNFINYRLLKEPVLLNKSDNTFPKAYYQELVFDSVARFYNYPLNFEIPYRLNHLTFHFSAIDWAAPHKLKYQYKLEGFEKQWSQINSENKADYRNIPYGKFVFKVRAIGAASNWSETFEYTFTIHPPWWHTWWVRVLFVIFWLIAGLLILRWRTAKLKASQKILEQKVKERTVEVVNQKQEIEDKNEELSQQNEEIQSINSSLNEQKGIIEERNTELNAQNEEITTQRDQLSKHNNSINESILYAKRIQTAVLPRDAYIDEILPDNFILNIPRNVVSGDFYVVRQVDHYIIIAVADCTGHGVPGAIMSMLGISFLNEIVRNKETTQANQVLNELRKQIKRSLHQTGRKGETEDGMDVALCALDTRTNILQYSGANNPVYIVQNGEFKEIKPDRMPIGFYINEKASFTNHEIQLNDGDIFYLFSDGFMDQFGGKNGFKYKASNFQQILFENHNRPMVIQKELLDQELKNWMKGYEQTDDILVMGVRV